MDEPWNTVFWYAEHAVTIIFLPAVFTHELCHYVGYRIFGYDAKIVLSDLKFNRKKSHIKSSADANLLEAFIILIILPTLLLIPAFSLLFFVIQSELSPEASFFVLMQGFGFLAQSGPSRGDTKSVESTLFRIEAEKAAAKAIAEANDNDIIREWDSLYPHGLTDRITRGQIEDGLYYAGAAITAIAGIIWMVILFMEYPYYSFIWNLLASVW
jgi:hypothetical protein